MEYIKELFPIFKSHPDLVYLDTSATSQKPIQVIDSISKFYSNFNANVHRGIYPLSDKATELYQLSREKVADFIGADAKEVIFTPGATYSLNMLAMMLSSTYEQPRVLVSELEHHANILPWQRIVKSDSDLSYIPITSDFQLDLTNLPDQNIDIISLVHISNVTGTIITAEQIKTLKKTYPQAIVVLDISQTVGHQKIDLSKLEVDAVVFSGHKMYGPTGVGILWAKMDLLKEFAPYILGGGMISEVGKYSASWTDIPERFEAGTPPIAQAFGLSAAIEFINQTGIEKIAAHEQALRKKFFEKVSDISGVTLFHPSLDSDAAAIFSFSIDGVHPHDVAQVMSESNIAVRAGHHCTQILHKHVLDIPASTRASFGVYNNEEDIDKLISAISSVIEVFS